MSTNPFEYSDSISFTKKNLMRGSENDELAEKSYNQYMVNKALSYYQDTIFYVNETNAIPYMDNKLIYEFLINSVRKRKRPKVKWAKPIEDVSVNNVMEYFGYNRQKAEEAIRILSKEQLTQIEQFLDKGGKVK